MRVIGPGARDAVAEKLAIDWDDPKSRKAFAQSQHCDDFVKTGLWGGGSTFALVWAEEALGLDVALFRGSDEKVL